MVCGHHRVPWAISLMIRGRSMAHADSVGAVILEARVGTAAGTGNRLMRVVVLSAYP
jgi:hypothetical protein